MIKSVEQYKPRLTRPTSGNKYYIRSVDGGYSPCIYGSPKDKQCPVLSNCVGYGAGRFNEVVEEAGEGTGWKYLGSRNAEDMAALAKEQGLMVSQTPQLGAMACWSKGKVGNSADGAGHIAVVEKITYAEDGSIKTITTSESGYGNSNPFWTTERKYANGTWGAGAGYTFLGFILNPAVQIDGKQGTDSVEGSKDGTAVPTVVLRKGSTGSGVRWLQECLVKTGYLRSGEVDGDFGRITLGAVLAFQLENGLGVDGVVGSQTKAALLRKCY